MKPTVVLTRPEGNNTALEARLSEQHWPVLIQPILEIVPLSLEDVSDIPSFGEAGICLFISGNAARMGLPLLGKVLSEQQPLLLAVGEATAGALAEAGFDATTPERPDSEGLLSLPCLQNVAGVTVVIVKGEGGRGLLADVLRQRGAKVQEFVCYRRAPAAVDAGQFCWQLVEQDSVIFQANSGETLEILTDLLGRGGQPNLLDSLVIVPSARVAELAGKLGWSRVIVSANAGDDAFVQALMSAVAADSQIKEATADPAPSMTRGETTMTDVSESAASSEQKPTGDDNATLGVEAPKYLEQIIVEDAPKPKRADWFARLVLLLLVAAMGGAGFAGWKWLWPQWQAQQQVLAETREALSVVKSERAFLEQALNQAFERRLADIEATAAAAMREQLAVAARGRAEGDAALDAMKARLDRLDIRLARLTATDRRAWLANEAAFLVRLAAQRLLASRDVDAATALLNNADALMAETDDPRLDAARKAIAADRAALAAAPKVDAVGLYARFAALVGQAAVLDVVIAPDVAKSALPADAGWLDRAEAGWQAALLKLSDYLVIRRRDNEMARLMTPDWEVLARQNLRMLLEQAQIAALSGNQALFDTAIERAQIFVAEFGDSDPDRARAISEELSALQGINVAPELPDLLASRAAIADAIRLMDGEVLEEAGQGVDLSEASD